MTRLAMLALLHAAVAHADNRAAAERYFHAGEKAFQAQDFEAAAQDFEAAYRELPIPEIAFSAAQAYRRQYHIDPKVEYVRRGLELFKLYVKAIKVGGRVADAADAINDMERELDRLIRAGAKVSPQEAAEHTQLGISVLFSDLASGGALHEVDDGTRRAGPPVTVILDGKHVEPYKPNNVTPGPHAIHVTAAGYKPVDRAEQVVQGTSSMVEVQLAPEPARIAIVTEATAAIGLDGHPVGAAPLAPVSVPAGKHVVTILRRGRVAFAREVALGNGEQIELRAPLAPTAQRHAVPALAITGATLGALALGTGIATWIYERRATSALDRLHGGNASASDLDQYDAARSHRNALGATSLVLAGGAFVAGAVALGLYYFDNPEVDDARVTRTVDHTGPPFGGAAGHGGAVTIVAPVALPSGGGAILFGRF